VEKKHYKVIVADDIFSNQLLVKSIIELEGYYCKVVANGKLLVEAYMIDDYKIVFTDIEMPVMNGIEVLEYIRTKIEVPGTKIPVIAMTAHNINELPDKIRNSDFDDIITKPYSVDKIRKVLEKYMID
jgi:CheY-like chemotaxis protein